VICWAWAAADAESAAVTLAAHRRTRSYVRGVMNTDAAPQCAAEGWYSPSFVVPM
jgi:hypothetical protein